jgi:phosphoglycolate phosphatase
MDGKAARTLLIDLDGTLVHSLPDLATALNRLLAGEGWPELAQDEVRTMVGDGVVKLVERGYEARGGLPEGELNGRVARFLELYDEVMTDETRPYPGVPETLAELREAGWRLAVCTNKPEAASHKVLRNLGLSDHFQAVTGGDSFTVKKPDAGHLLGTLQRLGAEPADAILMGDSPTDLQAARNAGLPVILVSYGYSRVPIAQLEPDAVIDSFAELPDALAKLAP